MVRRKLLTVISCSILALSFISGCAKPTGSASAPSIEMSKPVSENKVTDFYFAQSTGWGPGSYSYEIDSSSGTPVFYYNDFEYTKEYPEEGERDAVISCDIDEVFLDDLTRICEESDISEFDGGYFSSESEIRDGTGEDFDITYKDGSRISFSTYMAANEEITAFRKKIDDLFEPLVARVTRETKKWKVSND